MKAIILVFISGILLLSAQAFVFAQDASTDVLVFGPSQQEDAEEDGVPADANLDAVPGPAVMGDTVSGTRVADVTVSKAVTLTEPWQIAYIDNPMQVGFTLVQIDKNGKEIPVYSIDTPVKAMGEKFPAGTYKLYPYKAGGVETGEILVSIQCMFGFQEGE
jgi:hypothetical protein